MVSASDVRHRLASATDVVGSSSQQVAGSTPGTRVSVADGKVAAAQQVRQFLRVDFVVFDLSAVDRFEVQCMSQHELNLMFFAKIAQPVPIKGRLASDDQAVRLPCERFDRLEKCVSVSRMKIPVQSFFTAVIDDTDVHLIGVQVDSAVEWVLFLIQIHWFSLWLSKY